MSVEEARNWYLTGALMAQIAERWCSPERCSECRAAYLRVDAASISLDLAVAEESEERIRRGVAW